MRSSSRARNHPAAHCVLFVLTLLLHHPSVGAAEESPNEAFFKQKISPILEARCIACHQGLTGRGGLALDTAPGLAEGGDSGPSIVAGKVDESFLLDMIEGDQPEMPREGSPLTADEIAAFRKWIAEGATWPEGLILQDRQKQGPWWSLNPLDRPAVPQLTSKGIRNPIDAFVLARLEAEGLTPSPPADRRTLIRRVSFDLVGLPPEPEEVEQFVQDEDPRAYEKLVDRLLDSPRYGERWARHWLDVVHYGETHGFDKDKRRDHSWPYRDYVIQALNEDTPYGRFIQEQVAGDVLFPDDPRGIVATGFLASGPWDFVGHVELREGTIEKRKTRSLDRDDMLATVISTFNSMTVHCARCHDHPFDPIAQVDYYRLQAVFAGVERGDREYDAPELHQQRHVLQTALESVEDQLEEICATTLALKSRELAALDASRAEAEKALEGVSPLVSDTEARPKSPTNGYHSAIEKKADVVKWVQVDLGRTLPIEAVHLWPARPTDFRDTPGFGFPLRFKIELADAADFTEPLVVLDSTAADDARALDEPLSVVAPQGTSARYVRVTATRLWPRTEDFVLALAEMQVQSGGKNVALEADVTALDTINSGRWHTSHLVDGFTSRHAAVDLCDEKIQQALSQRRELNQRLDALAQQRTALEDKLLGPEACGRREALKGQRAELSESLAALPDRAKVYAVLSREPRPIHVLHRGAVEQTGEEAGPGALACVGHLESEFHLSDPQDETARRAALARWLVDRNNVLTWRSIVNRVWHYHFGRGLVDTPNDFGRNGSRPTHPELLDWLAVEFLEQGQSLKALHRLIVTSGVYRQSSREQASHQVIDADNRFLWRMNRRRLEAEAIRDTVLAVSGKLDLTMGGPGFELFDFEDDHSPRYKYHHVDDPRAWRRSIYRFVVRSVPDPFMETLDCPDPSLATPVRNTTITALQALALMNNPFVVRQAEYLAQRVEQFSEEETDQVRRAFELALGRAPTPEEQAALEEYRQAHGLSNVCRLLLNTNEFIFID
jgi:hypothetical protein